MKCRKSVRHSNLIMPQKNKTNSESPGPKTMLSVIVPVYNEEDNLEPMLEELEERLQTMGLDYEVIFVNDASTDKSPEILERLSARDPGKIRSVSHIINCGESAAQATGFKLARGQVVLTMDADQQNDPADIPSLLEGLEPGVDCVCGVRRKRNDTLVKQFSSWAANGFRNLITNDKVSDAGCTFRVIRRQALMEIPVFNGMHRFIPTILRLQGFKVMEVMINDRPRATGTSKYGVGNRLWRGLRDCAAMRWYARRAVPAGRTNITERS
jgi:dolichol-phosphate mannosyltransferase